MQPKVEKLYRVAKARPGAHCGSDHELLIAQFRIKLKKVRKTPGPFWYNLNQILYNCLHSRSDKQIQGIRSDRVPEELGTEVHNMV